MKKTLNIFAVVLTVFAVISWSLPSINGNINQQPAPKKKPATKTPAVDPIKALYKNGGIVVWEKDGHGLVVAEKDIDLVALGLEDPELGYCDGISWTDANKMVGNLVLNGYSDWRLPTVSECQTMYNFTTIKLGLKDPNGKPVVKYYWTSEETPHTATKFAFHNGQIHAGGSKDSKSCCGGKCFRARAVRTF